MTKSLWKNSRKSKKQQQQKQTLALPALRIPPADHDLLTMLTTMRPFQSETDENFIKHFIDVLPDVTNDGFGNRWVEVGEDAPVTLFSCHTDTVHMDEGLQRVRLSGKGIISLDDKNSNCLGADDGTGVWLMTEMVRAGIPGLYCFHRGEERGCLGSSWIAKEHPEYLAGVNHAIAFDRRGYDSVVTHQMGRRGCSPEFAEALADQLGGSFKPDDTGIFTDTAEYPELVPETTNISVGYHGQHGTGETQDLGFALYLLEKIKTIDFKSLPCVRDPAAVTSWHEESWGSYGSYGGGYGTDFGATFDAAKPKAIGGMHNEEDLLWLCREYPAAAADLLESYGITADELADHAFEMAGGDHAIAWRYNS